MSDAIQAAVIGYGYAGRAFHSYLIDLAEGVEVRGIAARSAETRAKIDADRDCRVYEGFEQVLDDAAVDLVVIATPSHMHAEQCIAALAAGKHVVTDKPMCRDLAECDHIIEAVGPTDRHLIVFQNRRWDGDYLTVRKLIDDGRFGQVRRVEMAWSRWGMPRGWRGTAEAAGGRLYDLGSHMIDQLCMLLPQRITGVYARLQYDSEQHDVESDAIVVVGFEDGATGIIEASSISAIDKPRFYIAGSGGTFVKHGLDPQESAMRNGDIDAAREDPANYGTFSDGKTMTTIPTTPGRWRSFYEHVVDVLRGDAEPAMRLNEIRRQIAVIDAAFESSKRDELVRLDLPGLNANR